MYRTKYVKDIPLRSYGISQFDNPKNDFEKEMRELEKNFERELILNLLLNPCLNQLMICLKEKMKLICHLVLLV